MKEVVAGFDENAIAEFGADHSFDWKFCAPDAPWQNGCSEALIKSVKKSLKIAIGEQVLSFSEMQTVLMETADIVNERPIGRHPTSTDDGAYLSPNELFLGRSTSKVPDGPYATATSQFVRYNFVQRIIEAFWKRWNQDYFPQLIIQQKWHHSHRNLKVGDIVIIQDSNKIRKKWKLGRVIRADPSLRDGYVRVVDVEYKNPDSKNFLNITRPVQRLIVLIPVEEQ